MKKRTFQTTEEKIRWENEMLKSIITKTGGVYSDEKMDPEMENLWLRHIIKVEENLKNGQDQSVYDFLGRPDFIKAEDLNDDELNEEYLKLTLLMESKGVGLTCLCDYEPRVIYKFITEELFHNVGFFFEPNVMTTQFIYEEFHPNHDYDLREYTNGFLHELITVGRRKYSFIGMDALVILSDGKIYNQKDVIRKIELFQECWLKCEIEKLDIREVKFDQEKGDASVKAQLIYRAYPEKGNMIRFQGEARLGFVYDQDIWIIKGIDVPGF